VPTVARRFWLAFSPFVRCAAGAGSSADRRRTSPLAVGAGHQDLPFGVRVRPGPVLAEVADQPGHLLVHALQGVHRLVQVEDAGGRAAGLAEGLLGAQGLVPVLQDVGEGRRRQLQAVVQRHEGDLLPLAAAVAGARQPEGAEDGDVAARVQLGQARAGAAVGQGNARAEVARAEQGEEVAQGGVAQGQQALPDGALGLVDGNALGCGVADVALELVGEVTDGGVVGGGLVCEHGSGPPWQGEHGTQQLHVVLGEAPLSRPKRRKCPQSLRLPRSGRPVTPK
jgi:hypothetical protein